MEEGFRPHRSTRPPTRHEDMVSIPSTSSSDDLPAAFGNNINNNCNISTIRAALYGCAVAAGTDELSNSNDQANGRYDFDRLDSFDEENYHTRRTDSNGHGSFLTYYNFDRPNRLNGNDNNEQNDETQQNESRAQDVGNGSLIDVTSEEDRRTTSTLTPPIEDNELQESAVLRNILSPASSASMKSQNDLLKKILRGVKKLEREQQ